MEEQIQNNNKLSKKKLIIIFCIILTVLGLGYFMFGLYSYESTDDAYVDTNMVNIAPKVSGEIIEVYVNDNQRVKEGDLIAKIESSDYELKLLQAQARYEKALLNQKNAKANYNAVKSKINLAKRDLERYKQLYQDGAVSKQELDKAQTNYDNINANLTKAEQSLISETNSEKVADAEIKELKALKQQAELYLSYTTIYSPLNGTVSNKRVQKGMYVNPGTGLLTIVPDDVWIEANFKENQLRHIQPGQNVDIKIDTYPNHIFKGKVDSIQMASGAKSSLFPPENAVGSFVKIVQRIPVKIVFTNKDEIKNYRIIPGMSVVPKVHIRQKTTDKYSN